MIHSYPIGPLIESILRRNGLIMVLQQNLPESRPPAELPSLPGIAEVVEELFSKVGDAIMIRDRPHFGNKDSWVAGH